MRASLADPGENDDGAGVRPDAICRASDRFSREAERIKLMTPMMADQPQAANAEPGQLGGALLATVRRTLTAAGIDQAFIDEVVRAVASGEVYQVATASVRDQPNQVLVGFFETLDFVIDHIVTGTPLTSAREAAEALSATPPAEPGHHPFCDVDKCRAHRYEDGEILTEHRGPRYDAAITDGSETIRLWAEIGSDENLVDDRATVFMASNKDDGLMFDAEGLDKAIAEYDEFLQGLRHLRRVMGQPRAPKVEEQA